MGRHETKNDHGGWKKKKKIYTSINRSQTLFTLLWIYRVTTVSKLSKLLVEIFTLVILAANLVGLGKIRQEVANVLERRASFRGA
jgi:hypothetical protein